MVTEYLNEIKPYLEEEIINNFKLSDTWKIQLTIPINFISSKDNDEECVIHSKIDNIDIMINDKADEVLEEIFKSLRNRIKIIWKNRLKVLNLSSSMFIL